MDKIGGCVALHQSEKALKALMGQIFLIIEMICGRVGQQNIKSLVAPERIPQSADTSIHLPLCVLMGALLIAHGSSQAQNADSLMDVNLILHTDAAIGRGGLIDPVMVAVDIENRPLKKGGQKGEVERA